MKYLFILISLTLLISCNESLVNNENTSSDDEVLATWNGGKVTLKEFRDIYLETPKSVYKNNFDFDSLSIELKNYIVIKEILKLADSLKLDTVKTLNEKYSEYFQILSLYKIMEDSVKSRVISHEMIKEIFQNMKHEFKIRHILIPISKNAKNTADSLYNTLIKSPDSFTDMSGSPVWIKFDDLQNEFKKVIKAKDKGVIYKPFKSKFGYHIIRIEDIRKINGFNRFFAFEKRKIYNYLENEYAPAIDSAKYVFDDFLFRKYNIIIDTAAVDSTIKYFNSINRNQQLVPTDSIRNIESLTKIFTLGNYSHNANSVRSYFKSYHPDLRIPDRYHVIESAHSIVRRILVSKFSSDAGYDKNTSHIQKIRILLSPEYRKYYIYNYIIPQTVEDFETGRITSFPTLVELDNAWSESLLNKLSVRINSDALNLIK